MRNMCYGGATFMIRVRDFANWKISEFGVPIVVTPTPVTYDSRTPRYTSGEVASPSLTADREVSHLERVAAFRDHCSTFNSHRERSGEDIRRDANYDFNIASVTRK